MVGANGCGKSTLLRALSRMINPTHGATYLDGKAITSLPSKEVARRLGLLPQSPTAPDGITVADLVAVLHDLNHACRYATHLIAMKQGRIIAQGAPAGNITPSHPTAEATKHP